MSPNIKRIINQRIINITNGLNNAIEKLSTIKKFSSISGYSWDNTDEEDIKPTE